MEKKREKSKRVTITQVAEAAGVTIATVSHVINGTAPISAETIARVNEVIEELHYVPNMTAKSLRSKRSKSIGVLIPDLNNNFYYRILSVFSGLAFEHGFIVQIFGYEDSVEKELQAIYNLASNSVDTVVILNGHGDEKGIRHLLDLHKNVILADRNSDIPGVKCLYFDNSKAIFDGIKLLKDKGYRNIGFLAENPEFGNVKERLAAYKEALQANELTYKEENVFMYSQPSVGAMLNGYHAVKNIVGKRTREEMPDGLIAMSDLLAIGAMKAFDELGYGIPDDIGIISYDNLNISSFVRPGLTTIEQSQTAMGEALFRVVKAVYEGDAVEEKVVLPQTLIVRESC